MMGRAAGRAKDAKRVREELVLLFIELRCNGWSCQRIADAFGFKRGYIITATNSVKVADIALCGPSVAEGYW
ncbi:hypothetical protein [Falsihalocynthiibacter sp. CO-5D18]|uniref:hypothetical protein n=1 Tax=Falsihalocynthiibacter sp. CO-5D18 TaxID=3240872 RepID=UPI00350F20EC